MVEVVDVAAFEHETAPLISFHYLIQINNQLVQSSSLRFINIVQACINFNVLCMIRSRKQEKRPKLLSIKYVKHLIHYLPLRRPISAHSLDVSIFLVPIFFLFLSSAMYLTSTSSCTIFIIQSLQFVLVSLYILCVDV